MLARTIHIDSDRCDGCGLCIKACHEGAIGLLDGKAVLLQEEVCDGLGDCLPVCPQNAISFVPRESAPAAPETAAPCAAACPSEGGAARRGGALGWPFQLRLVSPGAPHLAGADVLLAADCTAFACDAFHGELTKGRVLLIGCPKLDPEQTEKLEAILRESQVKSLLVARMEVPCCQGIVRMAQEARASCGRDIPITVVTISLDGKIIGKEPLK